MKIIELVELNQKELNITNIKPVPQYYKENEKISINGDGRYDSGFCYLSACSADYFLSDGTPLFSAGQGSIVYLPQGSKYITHFHSVAENVGIDKFSLSDILVNFILHDLKGDTLRLSELPMIICEHTDIEVDCLFRQILEEKYNILCSQLRLYRLLYEILERLFCRSEPVYDRILRPAFDYIAAHPQFNLITIKTLAEQCHIHPITFRRHFKSLFHMSPRQFVDEFFIKMADYNLIHLHKSVAETAHLLGFNDVSYFCRFYRKHTGNPPGHRKNTIIQDDI